MSLLPRHQATRVLGVGLLIGGILGLWATSVGYREAVADPLLAEAIAPSLFLQYTLGVAAVAAGALLVIASLRTQAPGFVIVDVDVQDAKAYEEYRAKAPATIGKHGGRYIVRGGAVTHVEPGWDVRRFVILQFPSVAAARAWYDSPEYQAILPIRLSSTKSRLMLVEGLDLSKPLPM